MPPCIAYIFHQPRNGLNLIRFTRKFKTYSRTYTAASHSERPKQSPILHEELLTALHRTSTILPNFLPSAKVAVWRSVLRASGNVLSGVNTRRPRIAVLGLDELSEPNVLVSALLDDPLISDQRSSQALRRRKTSPNNVLTISPGELAESDSQLTLSLPWLTKMDAEILEIPIGHPDAIEHLHGANIRILIASPLSAALSNGFKALLLDPMTLVIFHYPTLNQEVLDHTISNLVRLFPEQSTLLKSKMLRVYPSSALSALDFFRKDPTSVEVVQTFQNDFIGSGMVTLIESLSKVASQVTGTRGEKHERLVLSGALKACNETVKLASQDAVEVQRSVETLNSWVSQAHIRSIEDVLGGADAPEVSDALRRSTQEMQAVMDTLTWWKLPFKIDELSEVLTYAAKCVWCRDLKSKLDFQTGRLALLSESLTSQTHERLHLLPSSYHSAVLTNELHQLASRPPELGPSALSYPLSYRLQQLQQPILKLHRLAQRALLTVSATTIGSVGGAYGGWLFDYVAASTAWGVGGLGLIFGLRWLVGRWEKGKGRWWEDWRRVGEGLERDLNQMLNTIVDEKVTAVPRKAANQLNNMVELRTAAIRKLRQELQSISGTACLTTTDESDRV